MQVHMWCSTADHAWLPLSFCREFLCFIATAVVFMEQLLHSRLCMNAVLAFASSNGYLNWNSIRDQNLHLQSFLHCKQWG